MSAVPMAAILVFAAVAGAVIGSFLNVVVHRVPAGASLLPGSACPRCSEPIRPVHNIPIVSWLVLRGRCADCGAPISARYPLVEASTAAVFVVVVWWILRTSDATASATIFVTIAMTWFAAASIALTLIDAATHRLPDAVVLPTGLVVASLFGAAVVAGEPIGSLGRAAIGMVGLFALYFLVMVIRPDGMGPGDVKLAAVVGLVLGWFGVDSLIVGAIAAFVLAGVYGLVRIAIGNAGRRTELAFGPWMLAGAWLGLLVGPAIAQSYLQISGLT